MEIREYRPGDERGILDLYRVAFGLELSLDEWRWFYRDAVIVVAEAEGRVVGHYAVQPRPFDVLGTKVTGGLVIGSMVSPEFRNVTTFLDTAKHGYAACRARGIPFVYAFPNDNVWIVRRRMLDWHALPSMVVLVATPVTCAPDPCLTLLEPGASLATTWTDAADSIRPSYTAEFLAWRLARPGVSYPTYAFHTDRELRGYVVLKNYQSEGHILALRVAPGAEADAGAALVARARAHFADSGATRISTWLRPASPMFEQLAASGWTPELGKGKNFGFLALEPELTATLDEAVRWDVAMLDSDVY